MMNNTYKCIYCLEDKPEAKFNTEHVISRMLGTYENAFVLNHCEVCQDCNSSFCNDLESVASLDSYEGLLRLQHIRAKHESKGRYIGRKRLRFTGQNGVFKGLTFYVSTNPDNPGGIQIEAAPTIGIIREGSINEYDYYEISDIPEHDDTMQLRLSQAETPIITFGYTESEVSSAFANKGYDLSRMKYSGGLQVSDVTSDTEINMNIVAKVDELLERLAAKNLFNFLCYTYGREFVLDKRLENLRSFIRYGKQSGGVQQSIYRGGLVGFPGKSENGHIIGTFWTATDSLYLGGFVSWFGAITYSFLIEKWSPDDKFIDTHYAICDNQSRTICSKKQLLTAEWPNSDYSITVTDKAVIMIPKKQK